MPPLAPLNRATLRDSVADAIRMMIVDGALKDGERVNEARLAGALGVSRTPVREGLNRLAADGDLIGRPGFGYSVRPLSLKEFTSLYQLRPILEPAALRLAQPASMKRLRRLRALTAKLDEARDAVRALEVDDEWHRELIAGCPNPILIDLIEQFMRRTRRYELALLRERTEVLAASIEHDLVLDALAAGDVEGACEALRRNLTRGAEPLMTWLKARGAP